MHRRLQRYTFTLRDSAALTAFTLRQHVPPHDYPRRRSRIERSIVGHYLLALEAAGRIEFPIRLAHALGNQSPDFIVSIGLRPPEGQEVTQATTRKYQLKLERNEKRRRRLVELGNPSGVAGYRAETNWCRQILKAVRAKLAKLGKGRYEVAASQNLLIYDDMDAAGVDHGEAMQRLLPRLKKVLAMAPTSFQAISIVTTQNRLLYDVSGSGKVLRIIL